MSQTLEQRRAADAWQKAQGRSEYYANLAKGLPALIMNSGLMQVLAFLHEKGSKDSKPHRSELGDHLRDWLHRRFKADLRSAEFKEFMAALMQADPRRFQQITAEAMAWLRWSRQLAAALNATKSGKEG